MQPRLNGASLHIEVDGPAMAEAIVLHHALAGDLTTWNDLTRRLGERYRVVRMDARGHGASEATPAPYAFETLAADVVAALDHLAIERADFLGLSMGGMVGQYLGLLHPTRLNSLILVSTTSRIPPEARSVWDERIAAARAGGMATQVDAALKRWLSPAAQTGRPDLADRLAGMITATAVEGYAGWGGAIRDLDLSDRLAGIRAPTLVVVGELDPGTPVAAAEAIHAGIPGARLVVMRGLSHMLPLEAPDAFGQVVETFLAAVESR